MNKYLNLLLIAYALYVAYLHHLYKVDEITGKTLASIHNERFVVRICDKIRESILDDTFEDYMNSFMLKYYHE